MNAENSLATSSEEVFGPQPTNSTNQPRRSFMTVEQEREIVNLLNQGLPYRRISSQIGINHSAVERVAKRLGIRRRTGNRGWSTSRRMDISPEKILKLKSKGMTNTDIARELDTHESTVRKILKRNQHICPECGRKFTEAKFLGRHRQAAHGYISERESHNKKSSAPLMIYKQPDGSVHCPKCGHTTQSANGIIYHINKFHREIKNFKATDRLDPGKTVVHRQPPSTESPFPPQVMSSTTLAARVEKLEREVERLRAELGI